LRVLGPHLLLSLTVLALCGRWRIALACAGIGLMTLPAAIDDYNRWASERVVTAAVTEQLDGQAAAFEVHLTYDPDAPSRWCNTVIINAVYQLTPPSALLALPPGFGATNIYTDRDLGEEHSVDVYTLQSRYVLWDSSIGPLPELANTFEPQMTSPLGDTFYLNPQAPCDDE
ncbi:MAG: hypothetical protein AAF125_25355, partial [Chloroflexota bacterium]